MVHVPQVAQYFYTAGIQWVVVEYKCWMYLKYQLQYYLSAQCDFVL